MAGSRIKNRGLQNTSSGYTAGTEGLQEKAGTPKEKLDGHHQTRFGGTWTSPGMKPKNWRQTEQNGVNVWPNGPI